MTRHTITRCDRPLGVGARSKRLLAAARPESTLLWDTGRLKATPVKVPQSRRRCGGVLVYALGSRAHTTAWTAAGAELERIRTGRRMHASFSSSSSTPLAAAQQLARIRLAAAAVPRQAAATVPRQAAAADAAIRLPRPAAALTAAADAPIRRLVNVSSLSPSAARLCLSGRLPLAHPCSSTKVRAPATAAPAYAPSYELHGGQDSRSPGLARAPLLACTSSSSGGARAQEGQEHRLSVPLPSAATAGLGAAARFRHCRRHQARTAHYPVAAGSRTARGSSPCRPSVAASRSGGGAPLMPRHAARVAGIGDAVAVPRATRRHHRPCSMCAATGPSSPSRAHSPRWPPSARTWAS